LDVAALDHLQRDEVGRVLGFDRTTLYRKLERYKLGGPPDRVSSPGPAPRE
jgi:hypothetical protein